MLFIIRNGYTNMSSEYFWLWRNGECSLCVVGDEFFSSGKFHGGLLTSRARLLFVAARFRCSSSSVDFVEFLLFFLLLFFFFFISFTFPVVVPCRFSWLPPLLFLSSLIFRHYSLRRINSFEQFRRLFSLPVSILKFLLLLLPPRWKNNSTELELLPFLYISFPLLYRFSRFRYFPSSSPPLSRSPWHFLPYRFCHSNFLPPAGATISVAFHFFLSSWYTNLDFRDTQYIAFLEEDCSCVQFLDVHHMRNSLLPILICLKQEISRFRKYWTKTCCAIILNVPPADAAKRKYHRNWMLFPTTRAALAMKWNNAQSDLKRN